MFKKKPTIKPLSPLRSSDRRKLAESIITQYSLESHLPPQDRSTPADDKAAATTAHTTLRNSLLPDNTQSARFTTTHGPELKLASGAVYVGSHGGEEARVLWFQIEGRIYPTVYTLWKHPGIVPLLRTPDHVVKKLQGGADLMIPGLADGPPFPAGAKRGTVAAIASTDRPTVPVAVGVCEIDIDGLGPVQGAKGKAVEIVHWAGDEVWSYSVSGRPGVLLPEEVDGWGYEAEEIAEMAGGMTIEDGEDGDGGVPLHGGENDTPQETPPSNGYNEHVEGEDPPHSDNHPSEASKELTTKEIDEAFRNAFLYGIYHHKTSNPSSPSFGLVFPLSQSSVMSTLIQPFLPAFTSEEEKQLQIKKTSWKNIKKFIKSLDKAKILKSKEHDGHETVVWDVHFTDPAITGFEPYRLPKKEPINGAATGRGGEEAVDEADDAIGQTLSLKSYFRPTAKLAPVFAASDTKTLTSQEVRQTVNAYIEAEQLASPTHKRLVVLNPTLANAVFDGSGSLDADVIAKGSVPRDALLDRVLHAMSPSYAIIRTPPASTSADPAKPRFGASPKIRVTLETRSGSKTVTKISGLEPFFVNARPLADELRKLCAGSTSVEPLAGASKKNEREVVEIMVQGPHREAVVKALERRGVKGVWVEVVDKTKKGKGR